MSRPLVVCLAVAALSTPAFGQRPQLVRPTSLPAMQIAPLDAQAVAFNAALAPRLTPTAKSWVRSEAMAAAAQQVSDAALVALIRRDASARFAGQRATAMDIDAMVQLVMFECTQDADADLRGQMAEVQAANAREKLSDMTQDQMLRLQALMQKRSQFESTLGNLMKASNTTSAAVISNLK